MESAAMRYKEIFGLAAKAAEDLRTWEKHRAQELEPRIAAVEAAVSQAVEREERTRQLVHNWWRMTADNVAHLPWLEVGQGPEPATNTRGSQLDLYLDEVKQRYQQLVEAVLSLGWRARRR
ncbi:MAG TPA: hypothetical protein VJT49_05715 [Amycolatopsis sp.]|uniref:hypothetical protein n=1 Tax=Amycolatopsis sp. TaxID=37632 RepID=UPI002B4A8752|nr:hypothetical protein [Amycolatopsis sp.]HKS44603.1 hypothetical protein [Amycolatopsis sp.]